VSERYLLGELLTAPHHRVCVMRSAGSDTSYVASSSVLVVGAALVMPQAAQGNLWDSANLNYGEGALPWWIRSRSGPPSCPLHRFLHPLMQPAMFPCVSLLCASAVAVVWLPEP